MYRKYQYLSIVRSLQKKIFISRHNTFNITRLFTRSMAKKRPTHRDATRCKVLTSIDQSTQKCIYFWRLQCVRHFFFLLSPMYDFFRYGRVQFHPGKLPWYTGALSSFFVQGVKIINQIATGRVRIRISLYYKRIPPDPVFPKISFPDPILDSE